MMESTREVATNRSQSPICGFWRRIIAFLIDSVVLSLLGTILGVLLGSQLAALGGTGPFVGFCITVIYFGLLDSRIGQGQSIGKKLLKVCVVNREGEYISLGRAIVRAGILAIPICLNTLYLSNIPSAAQNVIGLFFSAISVAMLYFYLFNRKTRQSLHDIATGSFVVKANCSNTAIDLEVWRRHFVICTVLVLAIAGGSFYMQNKVTSTDHMTMLINLQKELMKIDGVDNASVYTGNPVRLNDGYKIQSMNATVYIHDTSLGAAAIEENVIKTISEKYPLYHDIKVIQVRVIDGYNIGITKKYQTDVISFSPNNLQQRSHAIEKTLF